MEDSLGGKNGNSFAMVFGRGQVSSCLIYCSDFSKLYSDYSEFYTVFTVCELACTRSLLRYFPDDEHHPTQLRRMSLSYASVANKKKHQRQGTRYGKIAKEVCHRRESVTITIRVDRRG